jgi:predicted permease
MDNFVLSANVVLPLFFTMMAGYAMKRLQWVDDAFLKQWNRISFRFFLPILLFMNIYQTSGNLAEILMLNFCFLRLLRSQYVFCFFVF